jgi:hypothetical protein
MEGRISALATTLPLITAKVACCNNFQLFPGFPLTVTAPYGPDPRYSLGANGIRRAAH